MPNIIFSRDFKERYSNFEMLRSTPGCNWLLRCSRFDGMLTIDMVADGRSSSHRYAFMPGKGWKCVNSSEQAHAALAIIQKVNLDTANLDEYCGQLLAVIKEKHGLSTETQLLPKAHQETRNNLYSAYTELKSEPERFEEGKERERVQEFSEDHGCPITSKALHEMEDPVGLFGKIYERSEIEKWLSMHQSCPLTRKPASIADLKPLQIAQRFRTRFLAHQLDQPVAAVPEEDAMAVATEEQQEEPKNELGMPSPGMRFI